MVELFSSLVKVRDGYAGVMGVEKVARIACWYAVGSSGMMFATRDAWTENL